MGCNQPDPSIRGILQAGILSGLPFPYPGDLPDTGSKPRSPALQADSLPYKSPGKTVLEDPLGTSRLKFFSKKYFENIKIMKQSCGLCMCYVLSKKAARG